MAQTEHDRDIWLRARELGRNAGEAAASWVFDGNTSEETYREFLELNEWGDPAIDKYGPGTGWLSGEFADLPTPTSLASDLELTDEDEINLACDAYEEGADRAYWSTLETIARAHVKE